MEERSEFAVAQREDLSPFVLRDLEHTSGVLAGGSSSPQRIERSNNDSLNSYKEKPSFDLIRPFDTKPNSNPKSNTSAELRTGIKDTGLGHWTSSVNDSSTQKKYISLGDSRHQSGNSTAALQLPSQAGFPPRSNLQQSNHKPEKHQTPLINLVTASSLLHSKIRAPRQTMHPSKTQGTGSKEKTNIRLLRTAQVAQSSVLKKHKTPPKQAFKSQRDYSKQNKTQDRPSSGSPHSSGKWFGAKEGGFRKAPKLPMQKISGLNIPAAGLESQGRFSDYEERPRADTGRSQITANSRRSELSQDPDLVRLREELQSRQSRHGPRGIDRRLEELVKYFGTSYPLHPAYQRDLGNPKDDKPALEVTLRPQQRASFASSQPGFPEGHQAMAGNFDPKHFVTQKSKTSHIEPSLARSESQNLVQDSDEPNAVSVNRLEPGDRTRSFRMDPAPQNKRMDKRSLTMAEGRTSPVRLAELEPGLAEVSERSTPKFISFKPPAATLQDSAKLTHKERLRIFTQRHSTNQASDQGSRVARPGPAQQPASGRDIQVPLPRFDSEPRQDEASGPASRATRRVGGHYESHENMIIGTRSIPLDSIPRSQRSAELSSRSRDRFTKLDNHNEVEFLYAEYFNA